MYGTSICIYLRYVELNQFMLQDDLLAGFLIPKFLVFITLYSDIYIQNYISTVENVTWMNYQNFKYRYMKTAL